MSEFLAKSLGLGVITALLFWPSPTRSQSLLDPLDVFEPATESQYLPGARAAAMGGAQIAAGNDGSAIWYNPALLTHLRSSEIAGSLTHQRFTNNTRLRGGSDIEAKLNNTGLGGAWAMYSAPTEQGGLTVGMAINRVRSFDRVFRYSPFANYFDSPSMIGWGGGEDESGSLWAWSFGGAIEVSPKASIGLSLEIYDGHDDYSFFFDSTYAAGEYHYRHSILDEYTGISGKLGGTYAAANWLTLGAVIGLPTSLTVDQSTDYFESGTGINDTEDHFNSSYRYIMPFSFGFGAVANYRELTVAGDIDYRDYTQLEYRRGFADIPQANQTVKRYYSDVANLHLGAEYLIRSADISLRAGYYIQPIPFEGYQIESDPQFFTFGAGFLIDRTLLVDAAFLSGGWERRESSIRSDEEYKAQRFLLTLSYRFR